MLRRSKPARFLQRLAGRGGRVALCADLARIPLAPRSMSLVWSNMALHWVADPQAAIREFHRILEVDGLLMFSTLGPDTLRELRSAFAGSPGQRHVHGFIDMHDLGDMLVAAGFAAPVMDTETITLTYAGIDAMTADLRATGQTCALVERPRGLLGPRWWLHVRAALEKSMRDGRLPATIEVVYGHAWKPEPRLTGEGHAIVKVDTASRRRI
jgi:malonyl-CoA O-methyltransferase